MRWLWFWISIAVAPTISIVTGTVCGELARRSGKELEEGLVPILLINIIMTIKYCREVTQEIRPLQNHDNSTKSDD